MPTDAAQFVSDLERFHVLREQQLDEIRAQPANRDPKTLARELIDRGWLTPYQANLLLHERGGELVLGSFVLLDKLGEGGMGTVFRARNWKLDRVVAVKLIRKERLSGPEAERRFHREIRAAAQLEHPNVVRAYDADEVNGTHFFAMEFVDGVDLARLVREHGPLPASLACEYIRQAALGLQHAHERGLVHRDIKPANLLLARAKGAGTIKVLDMGLARYEANPSDRSATLTQDGAVMGTPDFMAPEQSVSSRTVDARADLYSLGCSLYFLLTGSVPFPGGSLTAKLLKHQMEQPKPLEALRPDLPNAVTDVVYKLMAKKPEERWQTAGDLAAELAKLLGEPGIWQSALAPRRQQVNPSADESYPTNPFWAGVVAQAKVPLDERKSSSLPWYVGAGVAVALGLVIFAAMFRTPMQDNGPVGKRPTSRKQEEAAPSSTPSAWRSLLTEPGSPPPNWRSSKASTDPQFDVVLENGALVARTEGHGGWNCVAAPRMNYHLRLEFRWADATSRRLDVKYHAQGDQGISFVLERDGRDRTHAMKAGAYWAEPAELRGGKLVATEPARDLGERPIYRSGNAQRPIGEWNTIELVCLEDASIQIINGTVVAALLKQRRKPAEGAEEPIIGGNLVLWNHGAVEFRMIEVRDITAWPSLPGPWRQAFANQQGEITDAWAPARKTGSFVWEMRDGEPMLRASGTGNVPVGDKQQQWQDYHLSLEFRYTDKEKPNVGVMFFRRGEFDYLHYFVDSNGRAGLKSHSTGNAWVDLADILDTRITPRPEGASRNPRSHIQYKAPLQADGWNVLELVCLGDSAVLRLNGQNVGVFANCRQLQEDGTSSKRASGSLILTFASGGEVAVRRIKIRDITTLPPEVSMTAVGQM